MYKNNQEDEGGSNYWRKQQEANYNAEQATGYQNRAPPHYKPQSNDLPSSSSGKPHIPTFFNSKKQNANPVAADVV